MFNKSKLLAILLTLSLTGCFSTQSIIANHVIEQAAKQHEKAERQLNE